MRTVHQKICRQLALQIFCVYALPRAEIFAVGRRGRGEKVMTQYLLMCRSLTYAQKSVKLLERSGITAAVVKAPQGLSSSGAATR